MIMLDVSIDRVSELVLKINELSVDEINQKLKQILIEPELDIFPQHKRK